PPCPPCPPHLPCSPYPPCQPYPPCPIRPKFKPAYAQLVKTATQSFTAPVDGVVTFNEQSKTDNIIVSNGAITFLTPGTYKLEYNLNVQAGAASTGNVSIYLRSLGTPINGTQVTFPLTNTAVEVISGGAVITVFQNQILDCFVDFDAAATGSLDVLGGSLFAVRIA
ncbi:MAG TPA: hypothetical protein DG942_04295, partial [Ruminococcaceae bacterium]|nr:hypothetical protein [Oscillospiraceae bacterium]